MAASRTSSKPVGNREKALIAFGEAVATLPFNEANIRQALVAVQEVGGEELATEAIVVAAAFEAQTKIVDATIRKTASESESRVLNTVTAVVSFGSRIIRFFKK